MSEEEGSKEPTHTKGDTEYTGRSTNLSWAPEIPLLYTTPLSSRPQEDWI